jgi:hypothetical protein
MRDELGAIVVKLTNANPLGEKLMTASHLAMAIGFYHPFLLFFS